MRITAKPIGLPLAIALAAGTVAGGSMPLAAQTAAAPSPTQTLQINTGRGRLVTLDAPMTDLFVANDAIADVQVRSPTQLYIFGKAPGETTVYATTRTGRVVFSSNIRVGNNIDSIDAMLRLTIPEAQVTATSMNGLVLLTGTVLSPGDAAEVERLTQAFIGEQTKIVSRIKIATPLQVNLQVRFAEVSRSFVRNIGVNLAAVDQTSGFKFGIGQGRNFAPQFTPGGPLGTGFTQAPSGGSLITTVPGGSTLGAAGSLFGLDLISALDLGETSGQVSTLATPNLTALSGETGTFLAGGEIPIPVSQGLGAVSVEYKQYGVSLAYTPTVLADGRISLRVRPEVSQLSAAGAVTIQGVSIPALTTRRAETTVELGSGESFMIAGLMQNSHDNSMQGAPGLSDVPILGALFRSNGFKRNETELVIVITPYLVKPVNANDIALPTDGYLSPNDPERVLLGQLGLGQTNGRRPTPTMAPPAGAQPTLGAVAPLPATPPASGAPAPAPAPAPADRREQQPAAVMPQPAQPSKKGNGPAAPGFGN